MFQIQSSIYVSINYFVFLLDNEMRDSVNEGFNKLICTIYKKRKKKKGIDTCRFKTVLFFY